MNIKKISNDELNRIDVHTFKEASKFPAIIVLDDIRSMYNIGSVFRTADAFRLEAILLCGITATPPNKEIHKTALGATESVDWKYFSSAIDAVKELKNAQYKIIAVEQTTASCMLDKFTPDFTKKIAFIFGNEVHGVSDEVLTMVDDCIEIPQFGTKHSLNVAVSVGIIIWDMFTKFNKKIKSYN